MLYSEAFLLHFHFQKLFILIVMHLLQVASQTLHDEVATVLVLACLKLKEMVSEVESTFENANSSHLVLEGEEFIAGVPFSSVSLRRWYCEN